MVLQLVEVLVSTSLGLVSNSQVSRDRGTYKCRNAPKKRRLEQLPAYETWLVPGRKLWVAELNTISAYDSTLIFLSDEENSEEHDCLVLGSIECRHEDVTKASSVFITEVGAVPTILINGRRLSSGEKVKCFTDEIIFGKTPSLSGVRFKILDIPLRVCGSSKNPSKGRNILGQDLEKLGIVFSVEWSDDSTHLLMEKFRVTSKLFQCLALRRPVVNNQWLEDVVEAYLKPDGEKFPRLENYLPLPGVPSASDKMSLSDPKILLPNVARSEILQGTMGFTCPGPEIELIRTLVCNCGGELVIVPGELVFGTAKQLLEFVNQKWQNQNRKGFVPLFYEPSRLDSWGSLAELKHSAKRHQKPWKSMPMIELCQRILYINKLNSSNSPVVETIISQSSPIARKTTFFQQSESFQEPVYEVIKGKIYNTRKLKPETTSDCQTFFDLPEPKSDHCVAKDKEFATSNSLSAGKINYKTFIKAAIGSSSNQSQIPQIIELVPLHKARHSSVLSKNDPFEDVKYK